MDEKKRFNVFDVEGTVFLEDHKEGSYHIGQLGNVDINCLNDIAGRLNDYAEENDQLKQELFESEKEWYECHYADNPVRLDSKLEALKEEFKERFGRDFE